MDCNDKGIHSRYMQYKIILLKAKNNATGLFEQISCVVLTIPWMYYIICIL